MAAGLQSLYLVFGLLLLSIHEAALLPTGQGNIVDDGKTLTQKPAILPPSKSNRQCEYKCASYERMCDEDKGATGGPMCTEECGDMQTICDNQGNCRKQCAFTRLKCDQESSDAAVRIASKRCMSKCTGWDLICAVPDDLSPIISLTDDGSGGKEPFEPAKCLRTCSQWDSLYRCTKWNCNSLPQLKAEAADGQQNENILTSIECFGTCVTWNKFGTCVQWKCVKMESSAAFQRASMRRGWFDDIWDEVKEWGPVVVGVCTLTGVCG